MSLYNVGQFHATFNPHSRQLGNIAKINNFCIPLQHPYIHPYPFLVCSENGGMVIQDLAEHGSMRDMLCKCKPRSHYLKKYCNPKSVIPVDLGVVKVLGRMILESFLFLHEKGIPYGEWLVCKYWFWPNPTLRNLFHPNITLNEITFMVHDNFAITCVP